MKNFIVISKETGNPFVGENGEKCWHSIEEAKNAVITFFRKNKQYPFPFNTQLISKTKSLFDTQDKYVVKSVEFDKTFNDEIDPSLTHITVLLDRSGSMNNCVQDAEGGLQSFIEEQKSSPGKCNLSLYQFDEEFETVFHDKILELIDKEDIKLYPRGRTALLDSIYESVKKTEEIVDKRKPALVMFVILTDGEENSSRYHTKSEIKDLIKKKQEDYNWKFTYLGAHEESFHEAGGIGIDKSSTLKFDHNNYSVAVNKMSKKVSCARSYMDNIAYESASDVSRIMKDYDYGYDERDRKDIS